MLIFHFFVTGNTLGEKLNVLYNIFNETTIFNFLCSLISKKERYKSNIC